MNIYLGIDVGSVTIKLALMTEDDELVSYSYLRTHGSPIAALQQGLKEIQGQMPGRGMVCGVGVTGSARYLAEAIVGADVVKNEITAQAIGALHSNPNIKTVIEIGGQDSKLIVIRDGDVVDFAMNTVCAAGTGSFLDQQASRLGIEIENLGEIALQSKNAVDIKGSCTVFAESDMIHKQQMGYQTKDIVYGLCQTLVRNYLNDVVKGKEVLPPITFQGGVAFNKGVIRAFNEALDNKVTVPPHHEAIGAIGMALLAREEKYYNPNGSLFKGFGVSEVVFQLSSFECNSCTKVCEIAEIIQNDEVVARWGGRCDLWEGITSGNERCASQN